VSLDKGGVGCPVLPRGAQQVCQAACPWSARRTRPVNIAHLKKILRPECRPPGCYALQPQYVPYLHYSNPRDTLAGYRNVRAWVVARYLAGPGGQGSGNISDCTRDICRSNPPGQASQTPGSLITKLGKHWPSTVAKRKRGSAFVSCLRSARPGPVQFPSGPPSASGDSPDRL
jgi:hypothetical protein